MRRLRKRRIAPAAMAAGLALAMLAATRAEAEAACDPFRDRIHQAQAFIAQRNGAGARQILGGIVAADPANVMANFLLGTLQLAQPGAAAQADGLRLVQFAVAQIPGRPETCARQLGWYSLYITLGAQYYARQDLPDASKALQQALAHRDALPPSSLRILYDDLGRLALAQGDLNSAASYYGQGAQLGNRNSIAAAAMVRDLRAAGSRR